MMCGNPTLSIVSAAFCRYVGPEQEQSQERLAPIAHELLALLQLTENCLEILKDVCVRVVAGIINRESIWDVLISRHPLSLGCSWCGCPACSASTRTSLITIGTTPTGAYPTSRSGSYCGTRSLAVTGPHPSCSTATRGCYERLIFAPMSVTSLGDWATRGRKNVGEKLRVSSNGGVSNFSKRFLLWDKFFSTYRTPPELQYREKGCYQRVIFAPMGWWECLRISLGDGRPQEEKVCRREAAGVLSIGIGYTR